jgi:hypothetical protein
MIFRPFLAVGQKKQYGELLDYLWTYKLLKRDYTHGMSI